MNLEKLGKYEQMMREFENKGWKYDVTGMIPITGLASGTVTSPQGEVFELEDLVDGGCTLEDSKENAVEFASLVYGAALLNIDKLLPKKPA